MCLQLKQFRSEKVRVVSGGAWQNRPAAQRVFGLMGVSWEERETMTIEGGLLYMASTPGL